MKDQLNKVLNFFYVEQGPTSAYNNRFIFGISEIEFYQVIDMLEEAHLIEAIGIRHSVQGYNIYGITMLGCRFVESGGFKDVI
ncbi:MAG: hypothetical protein ABI581_14275 [Sediminibacterium sp.]